MAKVNSNTKQIMRLQKIFLTIAWSYLNFSTVNPWFINIIFELRVLKL